MGAGNRYYIPVGSTETIEAIRHVKGNSLSASMGAVTNVIPLKFNTDGSPATITTIQTKDGEQTVHPGDWIVRDKDGIHTCLHEHFAANHVPAN